MDSIRTAGFHDCQTKFDREAMLESLARLGAALTPSELVPAWAGKEH
jgi:hypothetical protein